MEDDHQHDEPAGPGEAVPGFWSRVGDAATTRTEDELLGTDWLTRHGTGTLTKEEIVETLSRASFPDFEPDTNPLVVAIYDEPKPGCKHFTMAEIVEKRLPNWIIRANDPKIPMVLFLYDGADLAKELGQLLGFIFSWDPENLTVWRPIPSEGDLVTAPDRSVAGDHGTS